MSRSAADPGRSRCRRGALAALLLFVCLLPGVLAAETVSSPQVTGVEMTGPVRPSLNQIQDQLLRQFDVEHPVRQRHANSGFTHTRLARSLGEDAATGAVRLHAFLEVGLLDLGVGNRDLGVE